MRLLADESCDLGTIAALRNAGHDVAAIVETDRGAPDEAVIARAFRENRILLSEDKDFGELVYKRGRPSPGVILVRRFASSSRDAKADAVVKAIEQLGDTAIGAFLVVEPGRLRVRR